MFNNGLDHPNLIAIGNIGLKLHFRQNGFYRTFHPTTAECIVFSNSNETFSRINHMLGHKTTAPISYTIHKSQLRMS